MLNKLIKYFAEYFYTHISVCNISCVSSVDSVIGVITVISVSWTS